MIQLKTPVWMRILIIVMMLPVLTFPWLLLGSAPDSAMRLLTWLYPAYVIVTGICAWIVYPQRHDVAWILLALLALSHIGIFYIDRV